MFKGFDRYKHLRYFAHKSWGREINHPRSLLSKAGSKLHLTGGLSPCEVVGA